MTGFSAVPVADEFEDDHDRHFAGVARVVGPAWTHMPSLTIGLFGVQILWSMEMSYASPYLLSLGLPKSWMAIVFLAGPLSGLIVQPLIGILADNSKSRFGRRRPFILFSAALCSFATFLFGFTRSFVSIFISPNSPSNNILTVWLAIFSIFCIDFSVNVVQALGRALLVDTLPTHMQPAGNAWAARMLAFGSVAGFFVGNLDLPQFFPFFGNEQVKVLAVITALLLFFTQAWVCLHVKERVLLDSSGNAKGFRQELMELWGTLFTLPDVIRRICWIQFFAWLGWFPLMFYTTVYIGELHKRSSPIPENEDAAIALDAESTRLGTRALFYSALVGLVANVIVPFFVAPQPAGHASSLQPKRKTWLERVRMHLASLWAFTHLIFAMCMAATFVISTVSGATFIMVVIGFCSAIEQWAPFALLGEAILSHPAPDDMGSIHLADTRSTRAVRLHDDVEQVEETQQLFQADIDDFEEVDAPNGQPKHQAPSRIDTLSLSGSRHSSFDQGNHQLDPRPRIIGMGNSRARLSRIDLDNPSAPPSIAYMEGNAMISGPTRKSGNGLGAKAGAIIGIHNIFVVIPQFLMTGLSSIIFAILDPDKSALHAHRPVNTRPDSSTGIDTPRQLFTRSDGSEPETGLNSIAVIFRLGGIAAIVAFILTYRLAKDLQRR